MTKRPGPAVLHDRPYLSYGEWRQVVHRGPGVILRHDDRDDLYRGVSERVLDGPWGTPCLQCLRQEVHLNPDPVE